MNELLQWKLGAIVASALSVLFCALWRLAATDRYFWREQHKRSEEEWRRRLDVVRENRDAAHHDARRYERRLRKIASALKEHLP